MKKIFLRLGICLLMLQLTSQVRAQTLASAQTSSTEIQSEEIQTTEPAPTKSSILGVQVQKGGGSGFEKGDFLLSPAITLGNSYYGGLSLSVNAEFSINDKFAVGGFVGFGSDDNYSYAGNKLTSVGFGGKFVFHATGVFNDAFGWEIPEKVDLFATGYLGGRSSSYNDAYNNDVNEFDIVPGVTVGGRYFFTPKFGAFVELGYNTFGGASTGVSFKF